MAKKDVKKVKMSGKNVWQKCQKKSSQNGFAWYPKP